jgi:hypothetical protein
MGFDLGKTFDSFEKGIEKHADNMHKSTEKFHKNYVSKVVPDMGKYGDAAKFAAEMVPGVAEYNALKDGDWVSFAVSAGMDVGAIAIGAATLGTGAVAIKAGSSMAKVGLKSATKEIAEAGAKKALKKGGEGLAKKAIKETGEKAVREGIEKGAKEATEKGVKEVAEKGAKETLEKGVKESVEKGVKEGSEKLGKEVTEKIGIKVGEAIDKTKIPNYLKQLEEITGKEIPKNQKELLDNALKQTEFKKLTPELTKAHRLEFTNKVKNDLINQWEKNVGKEWPRYTEDVIEGGNVLRSAGQPFDAHHIIENSVNGPHEWWNLHPAGFPDEHQGGIHAAGSLAKEIFG